MGTVGGSGFGKKGVIGVDKGVDEGVTGILNVKFSGPVEMVAEKDVAVKMVCSEGLLY